MKYIVVLADGMADEPIPSLGDKTPLEVAHLPTITALAQKGQIGLVNTVPEGMAPGSDVANLSVMGYDPKQYHTGRSPLEAASIGVSLQPTDVTFRMNFVTLSETSEQASNLTSGGDDDYNALTMIDHSAGDLTTEEAAILLEAVKEVFTTEALSFYLGVSYRHLLLWDHGLTGFDLTPPHDILGQPIASYLPKGKGVGAIATMMQASYDLLKSHPINLKRKEIGLRPANAIWIWGEGKRPNLDSYDEKFGVSGHVISAVDLIKGIGILAGLTSIDVQGATGNLHTNYRGKAGAALKALLDGDQFSYIHIEAPDECGHQGDLPGKILAMERIDEEVVKPLIEGLEAAGESYRILIVPDHPTPIRLRTHTSEPVPFVIYDSTQETWNEENRFTEIAAKKDGRFVEAGHYLVPEVLFKKAQLSAISAFQKGTT